MKHRYSIHPDISLIMSGTAKRHWDRSMKSACLNTFLTLLIFKTILR